MKRTVLGGLAAAVALSLAACGGGSGSGDNAATQSKTAPAKTADACTVVSRADATKLFGTTAQNQPVNSHSKTGSSCMWTANNGRGTTDRLSVTISPKAFSYAPPRDAKALSGYGDAAYVSQDKTSFEFGVRRGTQVLKVSYSKHEPNGGVSTDGTISGGSTKTDITSKQAAFESLMKQASGKL